MKPTPEFLAKLVAWLNTCKSLARMKTQEMVLRKELFGEAFPNPTEGSKLNKIPLGAGYILQGDYKISRKLDVAVIDATKELVGEDNFARVITYKPSLVLASYKALPTEDLPKWSDLVTETPGSPSLTIVAPKVKE